MLHPLTKELEVRTQVGIGLCSSWVVVFSQVGKRLGTGNVTFQVERGNAEGKQTSLLGG
jgi:hypothetical protein